MMAGIYFLRFSRNLEFKRRWFLHHPIYASILFTVIVFLPLALDASNRLPVSMLPLFALAMYFNIKILKFCDHCGYTPYNWFNLRPRKFCPMCGMPWDKKSRLFS